jgi:hypothetical protein
MAKRYNASLECKTCGSIFTRKLHDPDIKPKRVYCSVFCKKEDPDSFRSVWTPERRREYSAKMSGDKNPNFGNKWTAEQRAAGSLLKREQFRNNPEYAYECGKSNRGLKFSKERIRAMHDHRDSNSYTHPHSAETKKIIGIKSKEKFTTEFKEKFRKTMESSGLWVPLDKMDGYKLYYKNANWTKSMVEYFSDNEKLMLIENGIFSKKNSSGWVRDHIVPRKIGYKHNVPYELLRHPSNLQFISHSDNIKKGFADRRLTLNEECNIIQQLIEKILSFQGSWYEQELCLTLIQERRLSDA